MKHPVYNTNFLHNVLVVMELTRFPEEEERYGPRNPAFCDQPTDAFAGQRILY